MPCEYCGKYVTHHPRCPLHEPPNPTYCCSICGEGIFNGEEYIENDVGVYAHWECVNYGRDLVKFLGYEIKEMDSEQ